MHQLRQQQSAFWLDQIVCLTTPFAQTVMLQDSGLPPAMQEFIARYEPQAARNGVFIHQQQVLQASLQETKQILLTSSTGSGKSLCFWAWIIDKLVRDPKATALVCFPTQALLWGQTVRLQEISAGGQCLKSGPAYGGRLVIAGQSIDWTVWKGSGGADQTMAGHERSTAFKQARLRIATIDKVHYSLLSQDVKFAARLKGLVLDEAHQYQGLFGAQVAYLLKRIAVFKRALGQLPPQIFLASATLPQAKKFAAELLSVSTDEIVHQADAVDTAVELVDWDEAEERLAHPPQKALLKVALFYDKQPTGPALESLLSERIFSKSNILYFSPSKYASRLLKQKLADQRNRFPAVIYDADLPPDERRALEANFRLTGNSHLPLLLLATNALELGVDIENLDVCFISRLPDKQSDFLQRIGRVGRRPGRPGLVAVSLSTSLIDEQKRHNIAGLFTIPEGQSFFLPLQLEWVKLNSLAAIYQELRQARRTNPLLTTASCQSAVRFYYGEFPAGSEIQQRLLAVGGNRDFTRPFWQYSNFRGGMAQDKVPLVSDLNKRIIAVIDRNDLLRDAHWGACYLDHHNQCWQVSAYDNAAGAELDLDNQRGIPADHIKRIVVVPAVKPVRTRGIPKSEAKLITALCPSHRVPQRVVYGRWEIRRHVAAYRKVNLPGRQVTVEQIPASKVLWQSVLTMGWAWPLTWNLTSQEELCLREMTLLFQVIFAGFLGQEAGVSVRSLMVNFSVRHKTLQVMDAGQGGSGVAAYLLERGVVPALRNCLAILAAFRSDKMVEAHLAGPLREIADLDQACLIVRHLIEAWLISN